MRPIVRCLTLLGFSLALAGSHAHGEEALIRLAPLPPPMEAHAGDALETFSRVYAAGGVLDESALVFLPLTPAYVRLAAAEGLPREQLQRLGPWTDAFLIQFNAYVYREAEAAEEVSDRFFDATYELRWGAPAAGDSAAIPSPSEALALIPAARGEGVWLLARFPDRARVDAFTASPLKQLRLTRGTETYVIDLAGWEGMEFCVAPPLGPPAESPVADSPA